MKRIAILIAFISLNFAASSQVITSPTAIQTGTTTYTNGSPNNSIFFICAGQLGTLTATPTGGVPGWNFVWQIFVPASNSWNIFTVQNNVPTSTLPNLQPGGYRVVISDGNGTVVSTDIAWICRINSNPFVDVSPIVPGCGNVQLQGQVNPGSITPYYNPPVNTNPNNSLLINPATQINVCFNAVHTWVSDLAFYLVGPPSCGSPTVLLSPNPGVLGQNSICNSGDNVSNLCFSSTAFNNLNICSPAPSTLSGTYGSYGPSFTPINWTPINGCDATQPGWAVQIYDCISLDVGALTSASLSFTGQNIGGVNTQVNYNSGSIYSPINDNSCSSGTASIFVVGSVTPVAAVPINFTSGYIWTANPSFPIPNATSSLNINLSPGPAVDTQFTLSLTGNGPGTVCGGTSTDTEFYDYLDLIIPTIIPVNNPFCANSANFNLSASPSGGVWSGNGIINAFAGTFSPSAAGPGSHVVTYSYNGGNCSQPVSVTINVQAVVDPTITDPGGICLTAGPIYLSAATPGGTFSGTGIIDATQGLFDPMVGGEGTFTISYDIPNTCNNHDDIDLVVYPGPQVAIIPVSPFCISDPSTNLFASETGGTWSGPGITDAVAGTFDPAAMGEGIGTIIYVIDGACPALATTIIEVQNLQFFIAEPSTLCDESDPIIMYSSEPGGVWSGNGIVDSFVGLYDPSVSGPGTHTVTYTINGVCSGAEQVDVVVVPTPQMNITDPGDFCIDDQSVPLQASPPGGLWSGPGVSQNVFDPEAAGAGAHIIFYTITGVCTVSEYIEITVNALPVVNAGNNSDLCLGSSITLNAAGAAAYSWNPSTGLDFPNTANPQSSATSTITYTVTGTSSEGCVGSDQVTVTVHPLPVVTVSTPDAIDQGESVDLSASGLANYTWTPATWLTGSNTDSPTASPPVTTVYTVSGTDNNGCYGSNQLTVVVIPMNSSLIIPNIITRNGDGENDYFRVSQIAIKTLKMDIFNRWGALVGSIDSPDGVWDPADSSDGTYYFILNAEGFDGKKYDQQGSLTILEN